MSLSLSRLLSLQAVEREGRARLRAGAGGGKRFLLSGSSTDPRGQEARNGSLSCICLLKGEQQEAKCQSPESRLTPYFFKICKITQNTFFRMCFVFPCPC